MTGLIREELSLPSDTTIVDGHLNALIDNEAIEAKLPDRFRSKGVNPPSEHWPTPITAVRSDIEGPEDPEVAIDSHLDPLGIDRAIVTVDPAIVRAGVQPDSRYASALLNAATEWLAETWLAADDRFLGSIAISPMEPEAAAEAIHEWGDHPQMCQVLATSGTRGALGDERYWPIYEAAVEYDLPVSFLGGGAGHGISHPPTGAGYPSSAIEQLSVIPANGMGQLLNLILEGAFVEFPTLRVVFVGMGYSWLPSFIWRTDKAWKGLTDDYPWLREPPSSYVKRHIRLTTYPIAEAPDLDRSERFLEMIDGEQTVMFGSNYPLNHGFTPDERLPAMSSDLSAGIYGETAAKLYQLA